MTCILEYIKTNVQDTYFGMNRRKYATILAASLKAICLRIMRRVRLDVIEKCCHIILQMEGSRLILLDFNETKVDALKWVI